MNKKHFTIASGLLALLILIFLFWPSTAVLVKVKDVSSSTLNTPYPGGDFDCLAITTTGAQTLYAEELVSSIIKDGEAGNSYDDPAKILGNPDDKSSNDYVSLGGKGAEITVKFNTPLSQIESITVCEIGASSGGSAEDYTLHLKKSPFGFWKTIGEGGGKQTFGL